MPPQPSPTSSVITGVVIEGGIGHPLADADVSVSEFVRQPYKFTEVAKGKSDAQGAFRFVLDKFATYVVRASNPGYSDDGDQLGAGLNAEATLVLDKEHPSRDLRFTLVRSGEVTGRVVDDETGLPISGFHVWISDLSWLKGEAMWMGAGSATTSDDGRFSLPNVPPGNYLASVTPKGFTKELLPRQFTDADLVAVDRDYLYSYWPGGHGLDSASPVPLVAGGVAGLGTIRVKTGEYYRVHVSIPPGACQPGGTISVMTHMTEFLGSQGGFDLPCADNFLLRGFQPGSYLLYVLSAPDATNRLRLAMPFEVADRNIDIKIPLVQGPAINGRIVVADAAKAPPPETIKIAMRTQGAIQFSDERPTVTPDASGTFHFPAAPLARVRVTVTGLGPNYDVKAIRYNGIPATDGIVTIDGSSVSQSLEIEIDDKPAQITGSVKDGDKLVEKAEVALIRWPTTAADVYLSTKRLTADDSGNYKFVGLAPGDYRIFAVSPAVVKKLDEPNVLFRLLATAKTVTLDRNGAETLTLKVTDLTR